MSYKLMGVKFNGGTKMEEETKERLMKVMGSAISDLADLSNLLRTIGHASLNNEQFLSGEIEGGYRAVYKSIDDIYKRLCDLQTHIEWIDIPQLKVPPKANGAY